VFPSLPCWLVGDPGGAGADGDTLAGSQKDTSLHASA
jgi:hypothetical protein